MTVLYESVLFSLQRPVELEDGQAGHMVHTVGMGIITCNYHPYKSLPIPFPAFRKVRHDKSMGWGRGLRHDKNRSPPP